jgi:hypothetical protein
MGERTKDGVRQTKMNGKIIDMATEHMARAGENFEDSEGRWSKKG